jgi:methionyl-tRNA formyltransferase
MTKIGLYLMGYKGLGCLKVISNKKQRLLSKIVFVVSAKDKSVLNDYFLDISKLAAEHQIPFYESSNELKNLNADLSIAIGWRWLIKNDDDSLVVFHDSLLPKYRGFNPLVTALIEGDDEIGVTAIKANREFDKGNIIGYKKTSIKYPIKIETAIQLISPLYENLLEEIVEKASKGILRERPQNADKATYSLWRNEDDYRIDWNDSAEKIKRMIDAVGFPYKGATTLYDGKAISINDVTPLDDIKIINRSSGKILSINDNRPTVVCGVGLLRIDLATAKDGTEKIYFNKLRIRLC